MLNAKLIKISSTGAALQNNANQWRCVLDTNSKLIWEVKQNSKDLHSNNNTYTWFDNNSGVEDGEYSSNCNWGNTCNTMAFVQALNKAKLCQSSNWRLPDGAELDSLLVYNDDNPLINIKYFPNTQSALYWSATAAADADIAIATPFFYGGTRSNAKLFDFYVRGVAPH